MQLHALPGKLTACSISVSSLMCMKQSVAIRYLRGQENTLGLVEATLHGVDCMRACTFTLYVYTQSH